MGLCIPKSASCTMFRAPTVRTIIVRSASARRSARSERPPRSADGRSTRARSSQRGAVSAFAPDGGRGQSNRMRSVASHLARGAALEAGLSIDSFCMVVSPFLARRRVAPSDCRQTACQPAMIHMLKVEAGGVSSPCNSGLWAFGDATTVRKGALPGLIEHRRGRGRISGFSIENGRTRRRRAPPRTDLCRQFIRESCLRPSDPAADQHADRAIAACPPPCRPTGSNVGRRPCLARTDALSALPSVRDAMEVFDLARTSNTR